MPNVNQIISAHNKYILNNNKPKQNAQDTCNCRKDRQCPLEGNCLISSVIYQATVTRKDNLRDETYIGLTENTFKTRFNGHSSSFNNEDKRNATTLSEYVWKLKDSHVHYSIKWKIISRAKAYSTSSKTCNLCLEEKFFIIHRPKLSSLNKRNELTSACRHRKKYLLCNYK